MKSLNKILCYKESEEIKIVIGSDSIIKVSDEDKLFYYGYDLLTDKFKKLARPDSMIMPDCMINLISSEKSRVKFAVKVCKRRPQASKLLQVSERTFYRLLSMYCPKEIPKREKA